MAKETVRYPDELVTQIEGLVASSEAFESKSEFHRFASEFLLTLLDPDHSPSVLGYGDILAEIEADLPSPDSGGDEEGVPFIEAYVRVRRHLLRGETEAAATYLDDAYAVTDREALLLEEFIARHAASAELEEPRRHSADGVAPSDETAADAVASDGADESTNSAGISPRRIGDSRPTEADDTKPSQRDGDDGRPRRPTELNAPDRSSD